jgi:hypothetical protein
MALFRLLRGLNLRKVVKERVHFMEGPYAVEVSMPSSGLLRLRGLAGVDRDIEWEVGEAPALPFILGLISQSREALGACRRQAWWSRDAEILESSLETLKNESEKLPG